VTAAGGGSASTAASSSYEEDAATSSHGVRLACAGRPRLTGALVLLLAALSHAAAQPFDPPRGDTRLVVLGDFNGPYGSTDYPPPLARVIDAITGTWLPDAVVFPGDVIAGQSRELTREDLDAMWRSFDERVAAPLRAAGIAYALAVGNHDASSLRSGGQYAFARDREAAAAYWSDPVHRAGLEVHDAADVPFHYSFGVGGVFVAVIDASSPVVPEERRAWLADQLASEPARRAAVRLVVGHLPLVAFSVGREAPGERLADAEDLADLMREGCAAAYVSGHHAAYYPGVWRGLELLAAGGIGARRLLGWDGAPRSTVTVVDVWEATGELTYTTFDAVTLAPLTLDDLPAALPSGVTLSARAGGAVAATAGGGGTAATCAGEGRLAADR
jgi:hypothetical protein